MAARGPEENGMKKLLRSITFIELTLMFSFAGVAGGVAIPDYVDASQQALLHSKAEATKMAKDVHSAMTAGGKHELPSVATLAANLQGGTVATGTGIVVRIDGDEYTLPTYSNRSCTVLTQKAEDKVACVGSIPS
jgi:hypothetical protein